MTRILVLALLTTLAACGGADQSASSDAAASKKAEAPDPGRQAFRQCAVCHSVVDPSTPAGKIQLAGPNLFGIYNDKAAIREGFAYSKALKAADITWDAASLDAFIERPSTFVRGNRMGYVGEPDPDKRDAIIKYLKKQK